MARRLCSGSARRDEEYVETGGDGDLGDKDCSLANIDGCSTCTKNADCDDPCDPAMCEVCFGQTEPPPGCDAPGCETGQSCTIDEKGASDCPEGYYCATGCCYMIQPG